MKAIKWILSVLLVITAVLYTANGVIDRISGREEGPVIWCPEEPLELSVFDDETAMLSGVTAEDPQDGDLTGQVIVGGVSKLTGGDTAKVTLLVFDRDDNMATCVRQVRYTDYHRPVIQLTQPLEFESRDDAQLLSRVKVTDAVDGDLSASARVSTLWATEDERVFSATVTVTNSLGDLSSVEVSVIIRSEPGDIRLRQQIVYVEQGADFDPMDYLSVRVRDLQVRNEVDTRQPGSGWVWYTDGSDGDFAILTVVVE